MENETETDVDSRDGRLISLNLKCTSKELLSAVATQRELPAAEECGSETRSISHHVCMLRRSVGETEGEREGGRGQRERESAHYNEAHQLGHLGVQHTKLYFVTRSLIVTFVLYMVYSHFFNWMGY